jgi:hypothetical protein
VKAYEAALQRETPPTLAILRIPRLKLEVPVYHPRRGRTRRRQRVAAFLMVRLAAIDAFGWLRARQERVASSSCV